MTITVSVVAFAPSASAGPASDFTSGVHALTDAVRTNADLKALKKRACVKRFAKKQARSMAREERMFHQDLAPILEECHLQTAGENVAFGFTTAHAVLDA